MSKTNYENNPHKKYTIQEVLNDNPDYLLERARETLPQNQSATLHSVRAQIEVLELLCKRVSNMEQLLQDMQQEMRK